MTKPRGQSGLFDLDKKWRDYSEKERNLLLYGAEEPGGDRVSKQVEGIHNMMSRLLLKRDSSEMGETSAKRLASYVHPSECPLCHGKRLNAAALSCKVVGYSINELCEMELTELRNVLETITDSKGKSIAESLVLTLTRMIDIGLPYLSLNRESATLSGGEAQRLKLVRHMGSALTGMTYIFDEPSNLTVHRDYENKSCPGDYIYGRLGQIAKEVNQKLGGAPAGPFKAYQGQVNADDGLNCRTAPVSGQVRKTYPDGTVLTITKEDGNWGYCGEGWVCLDYINKIASVSDAETKEDSIMDGKTFKKMYDEINPTYNTVDEVPSYWRADIKELVDKGIISGVGGGKLGLTKSDCKAAVLAKRIREKL